MCNVAMNIRKTERIAREEAVLDAMGAYEALARMALMASRDDLTKTQVDIIMRLALHGQAGMSQMADELAVSKEHITRAVNSLTERGLVVKARSKENFRMVEASLTDDGRTLARSIRMASIERLNKRLAGITPEDRDALIDASEAATAIIYKIVKDQASAGEGSDNKE